MEYLKQPDWYDFGPTFASEQLAKRHDIHVSKETVRGWMIEGGLWKSHSRKLKEAHPWRPRRSGYGELTQWDTSDHDWLEGRGEPVRHLVRLIDDATSRSWGRFVQHDGTRENMGVLWEYIEKYGRMVDTYTDRDSMFTVARRPKETEQERREAEAGAFEILPRLPARHGSFCHQYRPSMRRRVRFEMGGGGFREKTL